MKVIVLSDLHLGAGESAATDDAFVSFLEFTARSQSDGVPCRLIVLGDLFDLLHPPPGVDDPLAALQAVATQHRSALAALGVAAASGIEVDLVPGNHDSELLDPDLQEQLRVLVGEASGVDEARLRTALRVRPWFVVVPGVLYAEHGSQYHPLNAVGDPLAPCGRWSSRLPPGAVLDLALHGGTDGARPRALPRLLRAMLRAAADRRGTDAASIPALHAYAQQTGLSAESLAALRSLGDDSPLALARNLSAALLGRARYVESRQQHAAVAIHRILAQEGVAVPLYVFAHTHRVDHRRLPAGDGHVLWLNPGAWANRGYCFVEVEDRAEGVAARLRQWDSGARSARTIVDRLLDQEGEPATRSRSAGSRSADPVATP